MAKAVIKNQKVLEYIDYQLNQKHEGDRCSEHSTTTVEIEFTLFPDEEELMWELSGHLLDLIRGTFDTLHDGREIRSAEKF